MPDKMMLPEVAVLGAGPAGLMAAEVLAAGRRAGHRARPHAVGPAASC